MGVLGLWQLLTPVGQPVPLETLENKILAVDISIWLNQAVKGYRDAKGGAVVNAHLLSLFSRLCKLLFYKIRPIVVFDGGVPELKKQTIINRQQRRAVLKDRSKEAMKLLTNYVAYRKMTKASDKHSKSNFLASKASVQEDIFILPPLDKKIESQFQEQLGTKSIFGDELLSPDQLNYLDDIDIESKEFEELPPDIKQEILVIMKEKRKRRNRQYYEALPKDSDDFSSYQMKNLLKRRVLQNKIEEVQQGIQKSHCLDIIALYSDNREMVGEPSKIMSDASSHYILLKKINQQGKALSLDVDDPTYEDMDVSPIILKDKVESVKQDLKVKFQDSNSDSDIKEGDEFYVEEKIQATSTDHLTLTVEQHSDSISMKNEAYLKSEKSLQSESSTIDTEKPDDKLEIVSDKSAKLRKESPISDSSSDSESFTSVPDIVHSPQDDFYQPELEDIIYMPSNEENLEKNFSNASEEKATKDSFDQKTDSITEESCIAIASTSSAFLDSHSSLEDELSGIQSTIAKELEEATALLEAQHAKNERQASTIHENMIDECKDLLRLFGVPYVVSPMEAEAQCAFFDLHQVTNGTITDDSDIWLFGGKRVYRNFFAQKKYVEFFKDQEILNHFGLSRMKLINFAMLTGSDYSEGIEGVGPVTAMEIISEFGDEGLNALFEFKNWWCMMNKQATPPKNKVRAKLQRLSLLDTFPNKLVFDAYLNPTVDDSMESFSWGIPDLGSLRDYAKEKFGWNKNKVDDALLPVIKRLNERTSQTHLDSFFTIHLKKEKNLFPSKRVMSALSKINPRNEEEECDDPKSKVVKKARGSKRKVSKNAKRNDMTIKGKNKPTKRTIQPTTKSFLSEDSSSESN